MRYIIGLLLGIGLIVLTFILIFKAFSGSDAPKQAPVNLEKYSTTNAVMRVTVDGPVNANSLHQRVRITVSSDQVLFEQIEGYQGTLKQSKSYPSNPDAYAAFLKSLNGLGFNLGDTDPKKSKDERGYCPLGRRYVYEALNGGDNIFRWWSDSCNVKDGNFLGQGSTIRQLFNNQVPDYNKLMSGVRI